MCRVGSAAVLIMMAISSGTVLFLLWLRFVNILSSMISQRWINLIGLGVFCGMVGCLCSGVNGGSSWAENLAEGAGCLLECAGGPGSCRLGLMLKVLRRL